MTQMHDQFMYIIGALWYSTVYRRQSTRQIQDYGPPLVVAYTAMQIITPSDSLVDGHQVTLMSTMWR